MEIAALVVSIVSAVIAAGALWYARLLDRSARQAADAAEKTAGAAVEAAEAAQTSMALEKERRKRELTPRFRVTYEYALDNGRIRTAGSPAARLRVFLAGPSDLVRLDELTVTIRDDDDLKERQERLRATLRSRRPSWPTTRCADPTASSRMLITPP